MTEVRAIDIFNSKGKIFSITPLKDKDIKIEEIANALSNTCRYGGRVKKYYSVAEHSVLMTKAILKELDTMFSMAPLKEEIALVALLHDAEEAFLGDIVSPIKNFIHTYTINLQAICDYVANRIYEKYQLDKYYSNFYGLICQYDERILLDEYKILFNNEYPNENNLRPLDIEIQFLSPEEAKKEFLKLFNKLRSDIYAKPKESDPF